MLKSALLLGIWRAVLLIPGDEIPFNFETVKENGQTVMYILNAEERIRIDKIEIQGDSVLIKFPVFNSEVRAKIEGKTLNGYFYDYARSSHNKIQFNSVHGEDYRFHSNNNEPEQLASRYKVLFHKEGEKSKEALGLFRQEGEKVSGTFLTTTGDYRFLEGIVDGDELKLSCFDGAHAFLFKAQIEGEALNGVFKSGTHFEQTWTAEMDSTFELTNPYSLTFLKEGYDKIEFRFPDTDSTFLSLDDERFRKKVVIVQILGSWCPNCKDESVFLSKFHKEYPRVEIVGLAFERNADFKSASQQILRMKEQLDIEYPVLFAGPSSKKLASEALPMLNAVSSYPTTIFIDKKGLVRKIHTGFNGPATGEYHTLFVKEFYRIIDELLSE